MQTFKPSQTDSFKLKIAANLIKTGNTAQSQGKKDTDAGKSGISTWLLDERKVNVETLKIGDLVQIEEICLIEIGKQSRFDVASFQLAHPDLYKEFMKDCPTIKYKPLVK